MELGQRAKGMEAGGEPGSGMSVGASCNGGRYEPGWYGQVGRPSKSNHGHLVVNGNLKPQISNFKTLDNHKRVV